jgi:AAA15 family ATPase/GTPase
LFNIPVSDARVIYNKESLAMRVLTKDNASVSIFNSSSGIQSVVPLSIVTRYLSDTSKYDLKSNIQNLSANEKKQLKSFLEGFFLDCRPDFERAEETVDAILNGRKYADSDFQFLEEKIKPFFNSCFVNIVEEPEQNLYPESQSKVLYELLECMNVNENNQLLITTHSPYMLSSLTLAAKAGELLGKGVPSEKIACTVPVEAAVSGEKISLYETVEDGSIRRLAPYENLPSDDNLLNRALAFSNEQFAELIDLEQEFCG